MKVAVSATGQDLASTIDERFGRCRFFLVVETDDMSYEAFENSNASLSSSAGIQAAAFVASKNVDAVISGNCGPKAMQVFSETNIRIILNQHGSVLDAIEKFKNGTLTHSTKENVPEKSGVKQDPALQRFGSPSMGSGGGRGMGGGGGRGMGGGGGRGMGGGGGRGMGGGGGRGMGGGGRGMGRGRGFNDSSGAGQVSSPSTTKNVSEK